MFTSNYAVGASPHVAVERRHRVVSSAFLKPDFEILALFNALSESE